MSEIDLDELERLWNEFRQIENQQLSGLRLGEWAEYYGLSLIQRLKDLQQRVARLERVREAAQELEDSLDPTERGPVDQILLAALAALEEPVKL